MGAYGYISHSGLAHHGIKGQKWGVRRYQNSDGTLTKAGNARYRVGKVGKAFDDMIYELSDVDNTANLYRQKSYEGGNAVTRQRLRLRREMKRDIKNSYKNKEISKEYYKNSKKHLNKNVDRIVADFAGEEALKTSKRNRGLAYAQLALGTLVTAGAVAGAIYSYEH